MVPHGLERIRVDGEPPIFLDVPGPLLREHLSNILGLLLHDGLLHRLT